MKPWQAKEVQPALLRHTALVQWMSARPLKTGASNHEKSGEKPMHQITVEIPDCAKSSSVRSAAGVQTGTYGSPWGASMPFAAICLSILALMPL